MKLPIFLKMADAFASKLSHEELEDVLHEIARTLPEAKREDFLNLLESFHNQSEPRKIAEKDGYVELRREIGIVKKNLLQINAGEKCLDSEYNEEWDDWYNSDADEFIFMDPEGVLDDINEAMEAVHRCVDMETYEEGCELAEILSVLEVSSDGDYSENSPLCLYELEQHELLSYDFKRTVRECLYLTYMGNAPEDRPDELFCMMGNFECYEISLEDILQTGNDELPQFHEFLPQWIKYLGEQKGRHAEKFLCEAQSMLQNEEQQIENAEKYVIDHPVLYRQLLDMKRNSGEDARMLQVGLKALDQIPCSYIVRSDVALFTAEYACTAGKKDIMENCWLEAFRSNSTVMNYLRIRLQTESWTKYADDVKQIYEQAYKETEEKSRSESGRFDPDKPAENHLYKNEYCYLLFLEGEFDKAVQVGMNKTESLGWSATFMKQGLALLLLLLYKGEELPAGLRSMLGAASSACGFRAEEYYKGTGILEEEGEVFWKLFLRWKKEIRLSEEQAEKWLDKISRWIEFRVAGIMNGNYRRYYEECASYIAALGEVRESRGVRLAKAQIMESYRKEYSRRSAFHRELEAYGMKSKKKR